jgi:hypothetical protein
MIVIWVSIFLQGLKDRLALKALRVKLDHKAQLDQLDPRDPQDSAVLQGQLVQQV